MKSIEEITKAVKAELKFCHTGKANAITADNLVALLWLDDLNDGKTQAPLRNIIKGLIFDGLPVASCSKGYYVAETDQEVREYIQYLDGLIRGNQKRIDSFVEAACAARSKR